MREGELRLLDCELVSFKQGVDKLVVKSQISSVIKVGDKGKCQRCGGIFLLIEYSLKKDEAYCPFCIQLGRCQTDNVLNQIRGEKNLYTNYPDLLKWEGKLSQQQEVVSREICECIMNKQSLLVRGVTGSGKTEMLFLGLKLGLEQGLKIAIVAPRIDVCLELHPRLAKVFPSVPISLLYGGSNKKYGTYQFIIGTTHQLLRFHQWFDLIVVDEVDSYPLYGNRLLNYGVTQALHPKGVNIYLTATLTKELQKQVKAETLKKIVVPKRFHGYFLPVPNVLWAANWKGAVLVKGKLPYSFRKILKKTEISQTQLLIFCPSIAMVERLFIKLTGAYPNISIGFAHSRDQEREDKIMKMRQGEIRWLICTTILERGVTFPGVDVVVLGADHDVFNEASLIQIAGRCGRSREKPWGNVWFLHNGWIKTMKSCLKTIQRMNRQAKGSDYK